MAKFTGKAGSVVVTNGNTNTTLNIRSWTADLVNNLADSTDSNNYDTNTATLWRSSLPTKGQLNGSVSFFYDATYHDPGVVNTISQTNTITLALKTDASTTKFSCSARWGSVNINLPVDGIVEGTATFESQGVVTIA